MNMKGGGFMEIDGALFNGMSERYMDMMQTIRLDSKKYEAKNIFFWALSTIEACYWENHGLAAIDVEILAGNDQMSLSVDTGIIKRAYFYTYNVALGRDEIEVVLKTFVEVFNYTDGLVKNHFHAEGPVINGRNNWWTQANGRFRVDVHVDAMEK